MRSLLTFLIPLTALTTQGVLAGSNGFIPGDDRYVFAITPPNACRGSNAAEQQVCSSGCCQSRSLDGNGGCGTWGGVANRCCVTHHGSGPDAYKNDCDKAPWAAVMSSFDFNTTGTPAQYLNSRYPCPKNTTLFNALGGDTYCCPEGEDSVYLTENTQYYTNLDKLVQARCISPIQGVKSAASSVFGSPFSGVGAWSRVAGAATASLIALHLFVL